MENGFSVPAIIGAGIFDSTNLWRGKMSELRTTTYYELELPIGKGGILHINDLDHLITPDFAVVVKPGTSRRSTLPYCCQYIHIAAVDSEFCELLDKLPTFIELKDPEPIRRLFDDILGEAEKNPQPHGVGRSPESGLLIYAKLFELVAELSRVSSSKPLSKKVDRSIQKALAMIESNPDHIFTLQEFADEVHLNRMYFGRLFQSVIGKSPFRYMMERRINHAKLLLLTTDRPCGEIGLELGFSTETHFSVTFKKATGMTPSEFRKKW